jgi:hypothetical protein
MRAIAGKGSAKSGCHHSRSGRKPRVNQGVDVEQEGTASISDPSTARRHAVEVICGHVPRILSAVIATAEEGNYLAAKFLFEFVGIFPPREEEKKAEPEDCLAELLLKQLELADEYDAQMATQHNGAELPQPVHNVQSSAD